MSTTSTLRPLVKTATASVVSFSRLDQLARINLYRRFPFVVCYHRVVERLGAGDGFPLPYIEISVAMLERHLDWIGRHFRIVSLDDLSTELQEGRGRLPLAAVTFDDGYSDIYHHAFPLLKRKGIPAGIFVISNLVGSGELPMHERLHALLVGASRKWTSILGGMTDLLQKCDVKLSELERARMVMTDPFAATQFLLQHRSQEEVKRIIECLEESTDIGDSWQRELEPLNWEMLAEMRDGGMTIGSHSKTHAFLANEQGPVMREEVEGSRRDLQQKLGVEAACFAYPGGSFNADTIQAVASAGYRYGFTICRHREPKYPQLTIPRTVLCEESCRDLSGGFSAAIMSCQTAGTFQRLSQCTQKHAMDA
jgi:peptidoglycan/xylan/chitin deacetylase (PgdA/CDA1 family)